MKYRKLWISWKRWRGETKGGGIKLFVNFRCLSLVPAQATHSFWREKGMGTETNRRNFSARIQHIVCAACAYMTLFGWDMTRRWLCWFWLSSKAARKAGPFCLFDNQPFIQKVLRRTGMVPLGSTKDQDFSLHVHWFDSNSPILIVFPSEKQESDFSFWHCFPIFSCVLSSVLLVHQLGACIQKPPIWGGGNAIGEKCLWGMVLEKKSRIVCNYRNLIGCLALACSVFLLVSWSAGGWKRDFQWDLGWTERSHLCSS